MTIVLPMPYPIIFEKSRIDASCVAPLRVSGSYFLPWLPMLANYSRAFCTTGGH
jgi:hypothetical protein